MESKRLFLLQLIQCLVLVNKGHDMRISSNISAEAYLVIPFSLTYTSSWTER